MHPDQNPALDGLKAALGYVRAYRGKTFVLKAGGEVLRDAAARDAFAAQAALLHSLGIRVVVVHGAGPQLSGWARKLGREPELVAGRRVTDGETLELAKMVCAGAVSTDLCAALRNHGLKPAGLTGVDGGLLTAVKRPPVEVREDGGATRVVDYGHVGDLKAADASLLETLLAGGFTPVVASLAGDDAGAVFNVNADTVAVELALALKAEKLVFLLGAPGLLRDPADETSLIPFADAAQAKALLASGAARGGMRPKLENALRALAGGVARVHLVDGGASDALLREIFTGAGAGTMLVEKPTGASDEPLSAAG